MHAATGYAGVMRSDHSTFLFRKFEELLKMPEKKDGKKDGKTALQMVIEDGKVSRVKVLLDHCAGKRNNSYYSLL